MGKIVILSKSSILVSNNCQVDVILDVIDTDEGKKAKQTKVLDIYDIFGKQDLNEIVDFAYKNDDDERISGVGKISRITSDRCIIEILENNNNYQQIIRRAQAWQV